MVSPSRFELSRALALFVALVGVGLLLAPGSSGVVLAQAGARSPDTPRSDPHPAAFPDLTVPALEVPLVQIEVLVTDPGGEPVLDLEREDFTLYQRDRQQERPVPLAGFSQPPSRGGPEIAEAAVGTPPRHLVLYFHLQFFEPGDLAALREPLAAFLQEELPPDTRLLVAVANPNPHLVEGLTTDRQRVVERLDELGTLAGTSRLNTEYAAVLRDIQDQSRKPVRDQVGEVRDAIPRALLTRIGSVAEQAFGELEVATTSLARMIDRLAGLPGHKEVLVVSGRLPAEAGSSLFAAWRRAFDRSSSYWGDDRTTDPEDRGVQFDSLPEGLAFFDSGRLLTALAEIAAARGVTLHTLDASTGRRSPSVDSGAGPAGRDASTAARRTMGDRQALQRLAEGTGGRALAGTAVEEGLASLARDLESRYTLAFAPPEGADGSVHQIRVRVPSRRRLEIHHAPTYRALSRDRLTAQRMLSMLLLTSPSSAGDEGVAGDDNPLQAETEPLSSTPHGTRVAIRVPLAQLALVPEGRVHRGQISIFSSVLSGDGEGEEPAPVAKVVVPVRVPNEELLTAQGRRVEYVLELPAGSSPGRLGIAVRDDFQAVTSVLLLHREDLQPEATGVVSAGSRQFGMGR